MANVQWSFIDRGVSAPFRAGDFVSSEAGGLPIYEVKAVSDGRLWLREALTERDCVLPAGSMRWRIDRPVRIS